MTKQDATQSTEKFVIASEIIKGRELLGLTQAQLSAQSNVSLSAIKGYETGRNLPGARELKQLCQVLRVNPNRLIFGAENPFPERSWTDPSVPHADTDVSTARDRIEQLLQQLSSTECEAVYTLVYSLAVARHGLVETTKLVRSADLATGMRSFLDTGRFIPHLHAALLVNTKIAREFSAAVLVAAAETDALNEKFSKDKAKVKPATKPKKTNH